MQKIFLGLRPDLSIRSDVKGVSLGLFCETFFAAFLQSGVHQKSLKIQTFNPL